MEDKKVDNTINSFMDSDFSSDSTSLDKANDKPTEIDVDKKSPEKEHSASLSSPPMSPILLKSATEPPADGNMGENSSDDDYLFYPRKRPFRKNGGNGNSIEDGELLVIHLIMYRGI